MKYRWVLRPYEKPEITARLQRELNDLPEALVRALVLRGIEDFETARHYFRPSLDHLHDPFLMKDMDAAVDRIVRAIETGEPILVFGDYDVDGTTAAALMTRFLRKQGADAIYFIPNRIEHGYGLNASAIDLAVAEGRTLMVALDCGITAHEEALYARSRGVDLIVCDHHKALDTVPEAVAVLDPKRNDCTYPFKELSGCGIGFKVAQAVLARRGRPAEDAYAYLDLVAISTASDIVPLEGENRILMIEGLKRLQTEPSLGVRVLARCAGVELKTCTTSDIVFGLGPRINAAGRLGDASRAVALFLAETEAEAQPLADALEKVNLERRTLDQETAREAALLAERQLGGRFPHAVVVHRDTWHPGVIGIVASRLVERFYRPAVMLATVNDQIKGSARSISGINIYDALKGCEDLLKTFGGHDFAAGLALEPANLEAFQARFNEVVGSMITADMLNPAIQIDATLDLRQVDGVRGRFWSVLKQFAPFGPANHKPVFHARDVVLAGDPRRIGRDGNHVKFSVRGKAANGMPLDSIGFDMRDHFDTLLTSRRQGKPIEMLFSLEENTWNGSTSLQLKTRDLRLQE
ncbi:MAG: single-stranded-DNA-specific exonuclease RecJ [Rhodothermales bacterium]